MGNKFQLELPSNYVTYLEDKPEKGMGFQVVDLTLKNGLILKNRIVFNSSYLKLNYKNEFNLEDIKELKINL